MNLELAKLEATQHSPSENLMMIKFSYYGPNLILSYSDALQFIKALNKAELIELPYSSPPKLKGFDSESVTFVPVSRQEYQKYRMAELMQLSVKDLETILVQEQDQEKEPY